MAEQKWQPTRAESVRRANEAPEKREQHLTTDREARLAHSAASEGRLAEYGLHKRDVEMLSRFGGVCREAPQNATLFFFF